jgi:hypothetical protein
VRGGEAAGCRQLGWAFKADRAKYVRLMLFIQADIQPALRIASFYYLKYAYFLHPIENKY